MPPTDDSQAPEGSPPEKPAETPPAYVTRAELDNLRGVMVETVRATVAESMRALAGERRPAPPDPGPQIDDVSDADIEAALAEGKSPAALIRRAARAEAQRIAADLRQNDIAPLRGSGADALRAVSTRVARAEMPLYGKHPEIKKVVDQVLAGMPVEAQMNPDRVLEVYDYVVGRSRRENPEFWTNVEREEREAALRQTQAADAAQQAGSGASGRGQAANKPLTVNDVVDERDLASLSDLGRNVDGKPSGKSFEEFVASLPPRMNGKKWTADEYLQSMRAQGRA